MKALVTAKRNCPSRVMPATNGVHLPQGSKSKQQREIVRRLVQPKLSVGPPNDKYEQEADCVAERVITNQPVPAISSISGPESLAGGHQTGTLQHAAAEKADDSQDKDQEIQRKAEEEEEPVQTKLIQRQAEEEEEPVQTKLIQRQAEEEEEPVQTKLIQRQAEEEEEPVQTRLIQRQAEEEEPVQTKAEEEEDRIQAKRAGTFPRSASRAIENASSGSPLQPVTKQILESRLGIDLSSVRVHEDSTSHEASASINAKAFTHKNEIWLGAGQSQSDLQLMAHEATHVVQQGAADQASGENRLVQRREENLSSESEVAVVSFVEKAKALAAAQVALQQAQAEAGKSNEQFGTERQKKGEAEKAEASAAEEKKKAEQEISAKESEAKAGTEEGAAAAAAGVDEKAAEGKDQAPATGEIDAAFNAVLSNARKEATGQKKHKPAADEAEAAQQAAESPAAELESKAQGNQVDCMEEAETPAFDAVAFKAKLMERIAAIAPKTAKEADDFKGGGKVDELKGGMTAEVETQKSSAQGPMQEATSATPDASGIEPKPVTPLEASDAGPLPADINARDAAPKSKTAQEVEVPIEENTRQIEDRMAAANITDEQLAKSNEPEFQQALEGKKEAECQKVVAPEAYRQYETGTIDTAQQEAVGTAASGLAGMYESRSGMTGQLGASQTKAKSEDELARTKVAADIQAIYVTTKGEVEAVLTALDEKVANTFDAGAEAAKQVFEDYVDARMTAYKEERYGGWLGWARWLKDKVAGMPDEVNAFYQAGRNRYLKEMDAVIDRVVAIIGASLTQAKAKVAEGKGKIAEYVVALPENLREVGQQAADDIQEKFDSLEQSIDEKQDQLINDLATKYNDNLQAIDARIEELKAANAGLVDMVVGLVVGVIKTILKIVDMLTTLLAKIAGVIGDIIADPIGFLGNLIKGLKQGFDNFVGNIVKHLLSGLVKWLTGALGPMGITVPDDIFSLKGIFSLVLQVLGLTWDYFRTKAVKLLGEPVVKALETGFEIFTIVKEKGLAGLWEYIKEQFSNLKEMVIEEIKSLVITQVITAGVKWIIGLLNPAGAFIKAAMAIYEIVKFFIERAAQIFEFVNSVVDSIADIVKGNLSGAAQKVETALANSIPLVIGFLASLLGIGGLAKKVQKIIARVRKKIDKAIDKLLLKAKKFAKKLFGSVKKGAKAIKDGIFGPKKIFKAANKSHKLWIEKKAGKAVVMVASTTGPLDIIYQEEPFTNIKTLDGKNKKKAEALHQGIRTAAQTASSAANKGDQGKAVKSENDIVKKLGTLAELAQNAEKKDAVVSRTTGSLGGDTVGMSMSIDWLNADYPKKHPGSTPRSGVQSNLMDLLITDPGQKSTSKYIRGHLLNEHLGGEGSAENMFPLTGNANSQHLHSTEKKVKSWMKKPNRWTWYEVKATGISSKLDAGPKSWENYVNCTFACRAILKDSKGKVEENFSTSIPSLFQAEKQKATVVDNMKQKA